ncbi:glucosamine-6-phosphate deaminase [Enemella evansiae]|uniref:glucosamine-6-phosphate deaminase n=1 Tax=Enemella evansiae TaxID=2016499 RepID=UPI00105D1511|nr:glucosamine-6-phosphate deaminase [Enemella evansiae]TDO91808.1 glucosamine-6-phosphate deaminase [Enemella evansiae]
MEVIVSDSAQESARLAADAISALYRDEPAAVLGVATGSSPVEVYAELGRRVETGKLTMAGGQAFMLDEYVGLPADHPQRYRNVIDRDFSARVDLPADRVHGPDGMASDVVAACAAYEDQIRAAGGVDLQILGIGTDGHIAFNEPGSSLASRTRIKTLTPQTRADNARFFDDDVDAVPRHCLTQGVGTIMDAKHIVLLANGKAKAEAVHHVVEGPVTAMWPGSVLQFHPHVTVFVDHAAASRLQLASYYVQTAQDKPDWQGF